MLELELRGHPEKHNLQLLYALAEKQSERPIVAFRQAISDILRQVASVQTIVYKDEAISERVQILQILALAIVNSERTSTLLFIELVEAFRELIKCH